MEADRQLFVQCSFWASFSLPPFPTLKMDSLNWQGQYLLRTFLFLGVFFWKEQGFLRIRNLLNSCGSRTCSCLFGGAASPFTVCFAFVMLFAGFSLAAEGNAKIWSAATCTPNLSVIRKQIDARLTVIFLQEGCFGTGNCFIFCLLAWPICAHISSHLSLEFKKNPPLGLIRSFLMLITKFG